MAVNLTGKYEDSGTREYVVMQDDAQRTDRTAFIAFVRVMRQRDEDVGSGTVYISDDAFAGAGSDDHERNDAIARALVDWIAGRPAVERHFQLRATLDASGTSMTIGMLSETYGRQDPGLSNQA